MSTNPSATLTSLNGMFKEVYAKQINNLMPEVAKLTRKIPFESAARIGNKYHQPVDLAGELGFTHEASGAGAFALNAVVPLEMKDAQVDAYQTMLRSALDIETAAKSVEDKAAFIQATKHVVKHMKIACDKRAEVLAFYGGEGLGVVSSTSANGSDLDVIFTTAFAPGIWIGSRNMKLDWYNGASKVNTNAATVITAVDISNRKITISGNASDLSAISGTHVAYFYGAYGKEMTGLSKIITNATTLFNIDAATYELWKGQTVAVGGNLTLSATLDGVSQACNFGLEEKAVCWVSNKTFRTMVTDQAALRKYDASFDKEAKNGFQSVKFYGQNGEIEIIPHSIVKETEAFLHPMSLKRIGSTDTTFSLPGSGGEQFFLFMPEHAGYELRSYSAWQLFAEKPAQCVKFTGITNS